MATATAFRRLVRDHMRPMPVIVPPETGCAEAVRRMTEAAADCVVVVGPARSILGIVTERDVTRRIAFRRDPASPVTEVMTAPVRTVAAGDFLYHAIAFMRRAGLRHMPVVSDDGRVVGMLALHEALGAAAETLVGLIMRLTHEETVEGLGEVKAAQVEVAEALFADGVPATEIQALLGDINLDIYRRVLRLHLAAMLEAGWGEPPVVFAAIVMGSAGRRESFLFPDQDNGFLLADYPDSDHDRIDAFFIELAERMTHTLDAVGFPLCRGNVMATNPLWRKSLTQWLGQLDVWLRRRSVVTVRLSDIFFDFRPAFGDAALAHTLREYVTLALAKAPAYIRDMHELQSDHRVALGLFGRLLTKRDAESGEERLNLKYNGTLPLVEAVRLYALKAGVPATGTMARIDALCAKGVLGDDDRDYLSGAFRLVTDLLLRQQIRDFHGGRPVGNWVPLAALTQRERDSLVDCFRAVTAFHDRLRHEITGTLF